jgi:hypothetical protein
MSDADPAKVYAKLRADAAKLLNLDANKMSALESMQCDLVSVLMLELDMLQSSQLAGRQIDISRVSDAVKILRSLLPAATTEAHPNYEHEFDGAAEAFANAIEAGSHAIAAREEHLLKREVAEKDAEIARLRDDLELKRSVIAALGGEPPLPPPPASSPSKTSPSNDPRLSYRPEPPPDCLQTAVPLHLKPIRR